MCTGTVRWLSAIRKRWFDPIEWIGCAGLVSLVTDAFMRAVFGATGIAFFLFTSLAAVVVVSISLIVMSMATGVQWKRITLIRRKVRAVLITTLIVT